jgi:hypothetical protein
MHVAVSMIQYSTGQQSIQYLCPDSNTTITRNGLVQNAREFSLGWRIWFWKLSIVNLIVRLFFISRLEAQMTVTAYAIAATTIMLMHRRLGWVRLLGIGHFPWFAIIAWLIYSYLEIQPTGAFAASVITVIIVNILCLSVDDVAPRRRAPRHWKALPIRQNLVLSAHWKCRDSFRGLPVAGHGEGGYGDRTRKSGVRIG